MNCHLQIYKIFFLISALKQYAYLNNYCKSSDYLTHLVAWIIGCT